MTHIVIGTDGALHLRHTPPTAEAVATEIREAITAEVGEGGADQVRLRIPARGFVNGVGHLAGLERNIVGSLLLMCCGASAQPYAGPVVVTGWDRHAWDSEIRPLPPDLAAALQHLHGDIRHVLDGSQADAGVTGCSTCTPGWAAALERAAVWLSAAPTPTLTVVTPGDARWQL